MKYRRSNLRTEPYGGPWHAYLGPFTKDARSRIEKRTFERGPTADAVMGQATFVTPVNKVCASTCMIFSLGQIRVNPHTP